MDLFTGFIRNLIVVALLALIAACASEQSRAPVVTVEIQATEPPAPQTTYEGRFVIVEKGQNLYSISFEAGFNYHDVARWNNIDTETFLIYPGQKILLYNPNEVEQPVVQQESDDQGLIRTTPVPQSTESSSSDSATSTESASAAPAGPTVDESQFSAPAKWIWPARGTIVQNFSATQNKNGIDIAGELGSPVRVSASGKVVYAGTGLQGYGRMIIVSHGKQFISAYAHNSKVVVREGDAVKQGQKIAEMGNTDADRVKLHFEIRHNGKPVDPRKYLPKS